MELTDQATRSKTHRKPSLSCRIKRPQQTELRASLRLKGPASTFHRRVIEINMLSIAEGKKNWLEYL